MPMLLPLELACNVEKFTLCKGFFEKITGVLSSEISGDGLRDDEVCGVLAPFFLSKSLHHSIKDLTIAIKHLNPFTFNILSCKATNSKFDEFVPIKLPIVDPLGLFVRICEILDNEVTICS